MYTIEIKTKQPFTEMQKQLLMESVKEADSHAQCRIESMLCQIRGSDVKPEQLSYLLGIAVGGSSSGKIIKLLLSYEK